MLAGAAFLEPSSVQKVGLDSAPRTPLSLTGALLSRGLGKCLRASVSVVGRALHGEAGYCSHSATCSSDEGRPDPGQIPSPHGRQRGQTRSSPGSPCDTLWPPRSLLSPRFLRGAAASCWVALLFLRCLFLHTFFCPASTHCRHPFSGRGHTERSTRVPPVKGRQL